MAPYDNINTLYVERQEPNGGSNVVKSDRFFNYASESIVISNVEDFEVKDNYMFAVKKFVRAFLF